VSIKNSRQFGEALIVDTMPQSGGYGLGFRIDPGDQLYEVAKIIQNIHSVYSKSPIFGVNFTAEEKVTI
jgi:Bardet-Biedl syndrome 5 protein